MSIASDIFTGEYDAELDDIVDAVRQRREILSRAKLFDMSIGDAVVFNNKTKPRYLQGLHGKIVDKNRKTVVVDLNERYTSSQGRTWHRGIRVPLALVDVVKVDPVEDAFNRITANA